MQSRTEERRGAPLRTKLVRRASLAVVATFLGTLGGAPAEAHFAARTDSLWGFAERSEVVLIGRVAKAERFEERGHTTLPGGVRLLVDEILKGTLEKPEVGVRIDGVHQPSYREGERVLVFAERAGAFLRSMQTRSEKIVADGKEAPIVAAIRRYLACAALVGDAERDCVSTETFAALGSPIARLHQDAVVDLLRPGFLDGALDDVSIRRLGAIALSPKTPLVVRQGVTAKLGALLGTARRAAFAPLAALAEAPDLAAIRVAAVSALGAAGDRDAAPVLARSLADVDHWVRLAAVEATVRLGAADASAALERSLADVDRRVRYAALKALLRVDDVGAREAIVRYEENAGDDDRRALAQALSETRIAGRSGSLGDIR